jgi:hypothetical protein
MSRVPGRSASESLGSAAFHRFLADRGRPPLRLTELQFRPGIGFICQHGIEAIRPYPLRNRQFLVSFALRVLWFFLFLSVLGSFLPLRSLDPKSFMDIELGGINPSHAGVCALDLDL